MKMRGASTIKKYIAYISTANEIEHVDEYYRHLGRELVVIFTM